MDTTLKLLIGTTNPAKFARYATIVREVLGDDSVRILSLTDVGLDLNVEENGGTAAENARKKARAYAEATLLPTLSIDEALDIRGLAPDEQPGIRVRRYGGRERTDEELFQLILARIRTVPPTERGVVWTYALCFAVPSGPDHIEQVAVPGGVMVAPSASIPSGYPLSAITTDLETGKPVCYLTAAEQRQRLAPVYEAVEKLMRLHTSSRHSG